jgi:aldose sugar dehydrogenase
MDHRGSRDRREVSGPSSAGRSVTGVPLSAWTLVLMSVACSSDVPSIPVEFGHDDVKRLDHEIPACVTPPVSPNLTFDTIATGLSVPWDLVFLPDGRILVTERDGRIRLVQDGTLQSEPWAELHVANLAEAGLLGIDIPPDFESSGHVYVMMTYQDLPHTRAGRLWAAVLRRIVPSGLRQEEPVWNNRVVRLSDLGTRGTDRVVVMDGIPSGPIHAGGALRFGPDGLLYLGIGDGAEPEAARDPNSLRGKILRIDPAGQPPQGNLFPGSPVLALGLRNPQAIAWDPVTGDAYAIDHGPTGLAREGYRQHKDELNRVQAGGDFGWPSVAGRWQGGGFETPVAEWTPAIAPAGLTFIQDPESPWNADALVTGLVGEQLVRLVLNREMEPDPEVELLCQDAMLEGKFGRLRAIRSAPDGSVYLGTSNRDQRGRPGPYDDLLLRFRAQAPVDD